MNGRRTGVSFGANRARSASVVFASDFGLTPWDGWKTAFRYRVSKTSVLRRCPDRLAGRVKRACGEAHWHDIATLRSRLARRTPVRGCTGSTLKHSTERFPKPASPIPVAREARHINPKALRCKASARPFPSRPRRASLSGSPPVKRGASRLPKVGR